MKKFFKPLAALALFVFAGCVQDLTDESVEQTEKTRVTIGFADTKTHIGDLVDGARKVYWSVGDQISVNGVESSSVELSDDMRQATFEFDGVLDYPYSILYPAEMYKDARTITFPAVQAAANNTFAVGAAPMATYQTEAGNAALHHLAGVIRLQVKLPAESTHHNHALSRVEFRGNAQEQVSGDFAIDYQQAKLTGASTAEADQVVVAKANKTLSTEVSQDVFIVVPAIRYEQGFTVRLIDVAGHYMEIASKDITIASGEIKAMPVVEFVPTKTLVGVEIASAADLVAFSNAYNAGEYPEEGVNVKLTADIVFDDETNAAWVSIGTSSLYFRGIFDGCNFSIKNWVSSQPLFYATYAAGYVENLTLDATCQLTADFTGSNNNFGCFVRYHRGLIYNCHNNASLTITGEWTTDAYVGGLVGRMRETAKIEACSMNGNISAYAAFTVAAPVNLGGLVGYIQEAEGIVENSDFAGELTFAGAVTASNEYAYIGGIAGRSNGTVKDCSTAAEKNIIAESTTNKVPRFQFGGITGYTAGGSIIDCTNNSSMRLKYLRTKGTGRAYVGGITGTLAGSASLSGCSNAGSVISYCDSNNSDIGGIVGVANAGAVIDDCHNESTAEISPKNLGSGSYGSRYLNLGGVIGNCATSNVSNISNAGKVDMNRAENTDNALVYVGGCIGILTASLDGKNTITNNGTVTATDGCPKRAYLALGGVVGCINVAGVNLSNVSNTGNVTDAVTVAHKNTFSGGIVGLVRTSATIQNVTNSGQVYFSTKTELTHVNTALGGIVGGTLADNVYVVKSSVNNGKVSTVSMEQKNGSGMVCGGVVGILRGAGSEVQECTNNGEIIIAGKNNNYYDNTNDPSASASAWTLGGIIGFGTGTDVTPIRIVDCTNTAVCYGYRGYVGGIAGYVRYADISESEHVSETNMVKGANTSVRVGGITGYLDIAKVDRCTVTGTVDGINNAYTGGISGGMNATASIVSSTVNGTVTNSVSGGTVGAIVSYSEAGAIIRGCTATGQIGIGSDMRDITSSADFDASGNATIE